MNYPAPMTFLRRILNKARNDIVKTYGKSISMENVISCYESAKFDEDIADTLMRNYSDGLQLAIHKCFNTLVLQLEFVKNNIPSYFFKDKDLYDFLTSTKLSDTAPIIDTVLESGEKYKTEEGNTIHYITMHLRFPDMPCITCCLIVKEENNPTASDEKKKLGLYIYDEKTELITVDIEEQLKRVSNPYYISLIKLCLNFFYYLKAFPETITEGKLTKEKNNGVKQAKGYIINIAKSIVEHDGNNSSRGRVTHFRKGHFRHLGSDYYVNKKGKYVFIHDTIVQGRKAYTVNSDNNSES